jgi:hypothetical protein
LKASCDTNLDVRTSAHRLALLKARTFCFSC